MGAQSVPGNPPADAETVWRLDIDRIAAWDPEVARYIVWLERKLDEARAQNDGSAPLGKQLAQRSTDAHSDGQEVRDP